MKCHECGVNDELELGGGNNPHFHSTNLTPTLIFRPNLDIMPHSNVDIFCDLEKGIPFHDNHARELRAVHLIQHFSWKSIPFFLKECLRVLKPGGHIYIMVSDLKWVFEQVLEEGLTSGHVCSIWGEHDHPSDYHKCGFTYLLIRRLMEEAGFINLTLPFKRNPWEVSIEGFKRIKNMV